MIAYRIANARYPIFDPAGAMLRGGRWNSIGQPVIYAAESYAGAMLEVLVHANLGLPPKNHRVVPIAIPDHLDVETVATASRHFSGGIPIAVNAKVLSVRFFHL